MSSIEDKISLVASLIDWDLLECRLGHHFEHELAPPFRLIIGLLYVKIMDDTSYEEALEQWSKSVLLQQFCGGSKLGLAQSVRASTLSIWDREMGESASHWMEIAISSPQASSMLH